MVNLEDITIREMLYEGKAKRLYITSRKNYLIQVFKDDATAGDGEKHDIFSGKGSLNNQISSVLFEYLNNMGVKTHFIDKIDDTSMLVRELEMIPVEFVVRNISAGSISRRLGIEEGKELSIPIVEYYLKDDALHDPMLNRYHILAFGWLKFDELDNISDKSLKINKLLQKFLAEKGLLLVDFKLEYGKSDGEFYLGDEISPDTCRFWDSETREILDKDRFRKDIGGLLSAYEEILSRIT